MIDDDDDDETVSLARYGSERYEHYNINDN